MRTLALDPVTGDLAVEGGQTRLLEGADAVAQRLKLRLGLWQREYVYDEGVGIPYADLLGQKGRARDLLESTLREAARTCPGVASLTLFRMDVDAGRRATVTLQARTISGEPISLEAFRVGGA